jgi:SnoaL-like domain
MKTWLRLLLLVPLALAALAAGAQPPETAPLTADDLVAIRQLMDSYAQTLDHCTNGGEDYANLFTDDATFGVSSTWGAGAKVWFRGREELARVGGSGCGPQPNPTPSYHLNINPRIWATPEGARAQSTLLTITNDTDARGDVIHYEGGYEDTFEKTAKGWRFKSRVHVWSEIEWTDRPEDMPSRKLADE